MTENDIQPKNDLPQIFKQEDFDIDGVGAVSAVFETLKRAPDYILFPSQYDMKYIQRMVIYTGKCALKPGTDGTPDRYILFPSYSLGVYFLTKTLYYSCPFVAQFPRHTFYDMFYRSAGIQIDLILREYKGKGAPLLEIHFRKKSERDYELKYLAVVEHVATDFEANGKRDTFKLVRLLFEDKSTDTKSKK